MRYLVKVPLPNRLVIKSSFISCPQITIPQIDPCKQPPPTFQTQWKYKFVTLIKNFPNITVYASNLDARHSYQWPSLNAIVMTSLYILAQRERPVGNISK